jgi:hypothetical protein
VFALSGLIYFLYLLIQAADANRLDKKNFIDIPIKRGRFCGNSLIYYRYFFLLQLFMDGSACMHPYITNERHLIKQF